MPGTGVTVKGQSLILVDSGRCAPGCPITRPHQAYSHIEHLATVSSLFRGFVNVVSLETSEARSRPITRHSADPAILQLDQTVSTDALKSNEATSGPNIEASSFPSIDLDTWEMGIELLRVLFGQSQSEPQYEPIKLISVPKSHKAQIQDPRGEYLCTLSQRGPCSTGSRLRKGVPSSAESVKRTSRSRC